jgi:hypothetical protein
MLENESRNTNSLKTYNKAILLIKTGLRRLLDGNTVNIVVATQGLSKPTIAFYGLVYRR